MMNDEQLYDLGKRCHDGLVAGRSNVCGYGVGFEDNTWVDFHDTHCHARLDAVDCKYEDAPPVVIANKVQTRINDPAFGNEWTGNKGATLFYTWLFNKSPWAGCFLSKDPSKIFDDGILVKTHLDANLVVSACVASRMAWEQSYTATVFNELVKRGLDYERSFIACFLLTYDSVERKFRTKSTLYHIPFYVDHCPPKGLANFIANRLVNPYGESFYDAGTYDGMPYMWFNGDRTWEPLTFRLPREDEDMREKIRDPFNYIASIHGEKEKKVEEEYDIVELVKKQIGDYIEHGQ